MSWVRLAEGDKTAPLSDLSNWDFGTHKSTPISIHVQVASKAGKQRYPHFLIFPPQTYLGRHPLSRQTVARMLFCLLLSMSSHQSQQNPGAKLAKRMTKNLLLLSDEGFVLFRFLSPSIQPKHSNDAAHRLALGGGGFRLRKIECLSAL